MPDLSYDVVAVDRGAGRVIGDLRDSVASLADRLSKLDGMAVVADADVDTTKAKRGLDELGTRAGRAGEEAGTKFSGGMAAKLAGIAAVGASMGTALMGGLTAALDAETATARLQVQLGGSASAAAEFGAIAGQLYSENFGGSLGDVNTAIVAVHQNIGETFTDGDGVLKDVTATTLSLADAFGVDVTQATRAVGQLLRTGLAPDAKSALDIVTTGFQQGVDRSEDFLDTLNEYSPQFAKLGMDATVAVGLLRQGLQGGARDADIVADAFKEFSLRAVDGSKLSAQGFELLGMNAEKMTKLFARGGPEAAGALDLVVDKLNGMTDPVARNTAGVALFGTQFEDLGVAFAELDPSSAADALGDVAGAGAEMNAALGDTAAGKVETLRRSLETGVVDFFGGKVIPMFETVSGWGANLFGPAWEPVKSFMGFLAGTGGVVVTAILGVAAATWVWTTAMGALSAASLPITGTTLLIVAGIGLLVAGVVWAWTEFEGFRNVVLGVWAAVSDAFTGAMNFLGTFFGWIGTAITGVGNFFSTVWGGLATTNTTVWSGIVGFLTGIWSGIAGFAAGVWGGIAGFFSGVMTGIQDITTAVWNGILGFLTGIWNGIVSVVMTVWNGIGNYFESFYNAHRELVDGVWNWIMGFLTGIWNAISGVATTVWNGIAAFFGAIFEAMRIGFTVAWDAISAVAQAVWGFISNFFVNAWNAHLALFQSILGLIQNAFSIAWNAVSAVAQAVWGFIAAWFTGELNKFAAFWSGIWNTVSGFFSGIWVVIRDSAINAWNVVSGFFTGALNTFTSWWTGVWNNVVTGFQSVWGKVTGIAQSIWDGVTGIFRGGVNGVIDAINWLSSKVNVVLRFFLIPEIPSVPRLESGGVLGANGVQMLARGGTVGSGFVTDGPRAIVGEGNPNHPEFVIPTDPKYRKRAVALYETLGGQLMADGGVLGWIGDAASSAWGGITSAAGAVGNALGDVASWIGGGVDGLITEVLGAIRGMLPGGVMGDIGMGVGRKALDGLKKMIADAFAKQQESTGMIGGGTGGGGWQWQMAVLRQVFPGLALISGMRPGAITATGNRSYHAQGRAVDVPPRMDVFNWIKSTYGGSSREIIYSPAGTGQIHNGSPHYYGEPTRGDHWDHVHWAYANGGIIDRPTFGLLGESGPEVVLPMTRPSRAAALMQQAGMGGATLGGESVGEITAQLAALHDLLERRGAGASITVEDRSGDPAETARSTVLAMRLA